jgi:hypothetical protein
MRVDLPNEAGLCQRFLSTRAQSSFGARGRRRLFFYARNELFALPLPDPGAPSVISKRKEPPFACKYVNLRPERCCFCEQSNCPSDRTKCLRSNLKIGLVGFEPTASWSRTRRSTKLSHSPKINSLPDPGAPLYFVYFNSNRKDRAQRVRPVRGSSQSTAGTPLFLPCSSISAQEGRPCGTRPRRMYLAPKFDRQHLVQTRLQL